MATTTCLNGRLLQAILRTPSNTVSHQCRQQTTQIWVRTISTTSIRRQTAPFVSFGAENDAMLAPYLERTDQKIKLKKASKTTSAAKHPSRNNQKKASSSVLDSAATDDYTISDFVDRSTPREQEARTRDESLEEKEAGMSTVASTKGQKDRFEKPRSKITRELTGSKSTSVPPSPRPDQPIRPKLEKWAEQKNALKDKFKEGWNPRKKLSPDAMEGIRGLHEQDPLKYTTPVLAEQFKVSPEAIRRILKSKWLTKQPSDKMDEHRQRWAKRHDRIWDHQAELGLRPQRKKEMKEEEPDKFEQDLIRERILEEARSA